MEDIPVLMVVDDRGNYFFAATGHAIQVSVHPSPALPKAYPNFLLDALMASWGILTPRSAINSGTSRELGGKR